METDYKVINTKISPRAFAQMRAIAERANIKVYKLLQIVVDCYIKTFCESEPINDYMREILCKFIDIDRAKNGFSLIAPTLQNLNMSKCFAIVSKAKSTIPEIVLIEKEGDSITQNINSDTILTEFLQAFSPKILHYLQKIKNSERMHNLTDALFYATQEIACPKDPLHNEIEQLFTDANNSVISAQIQPISAQKNIKRKCIENLCASDFEPQNYKRTHNRHYDEYEPTQINFDPSQVADTLQDYEPEFDPSQIADPLQDYEPEYIEN